MRCNYVQDSLLFLWQDTDSQQPLASPCSKNPDAFACFTRLRAFLCRALDAQTSVMTIVNKIRTVMGIYPKRGWSPQRFAFKCEVIGCKGVQHTFFWTFTVNVKG